MKKGLIRVFFIMILFLSLGLNVLLLYDRLDNKYKDIEVEEKDVSNSSVKYNKETLGKLFKSYQSNSSLAKPENLAIFEVTKITYVGYFKSDNNKKLYYIEEKFSCVEGIDCLDTIDKVEIDKEGNSNTTFVVAVTPVDDRSALFEILDYSIEEDIDFQKVKHVELK